MEILKPNFIIVGSAKCGTTALASILGEHPDCCVSEPKEVSFFQDTIDFNPNPNFELGWEWYQKAFSHYKGEQVIGEATPSYSDRTRSPNTAKRIFDFNPEMKIIYMVRNPIERQISTWKMQYTFGKENLVPWRIEYKWALKGFEYWLRKQKDVGQWDECRYSFQINSYEQFFKKEKIYISFLEDWSKNKALEIKRAMEFLELDFAKWNPYFEERANKASERKVPRPFLKKVRNLELAKFVIRLFPLKLREYARKNIAVKQINVPEAICSNEIKQEFLDYIKTDALDFLKSNNKQSDFWKSIGEI